MISTRQFLSAVLTCGTIVFSEALYLPSQANHLPNEMADTPDTGVSTTIEGLVRDAAYPVQNHKSTATHFNLACALACARAGSPLVILTNTGAMYFPMKNTMPDDGSQREKLLPYVGKYVRVFDTVYQRNGTRFIVPGTISEMKDVKIDTNLGRD